MNIKRTQTANVDYVGHGDDQIVVFEGKILGFIHYNKKAEIQATRDGDWFTGPRWEMTHRDGMKLKYLPASRKDAARWLLAYKNKKGIT